jgi:hypothetical protein
MTTRARWEKCSGQLVALKPAVRASDGGMGQEIFFG